EKAEVEVHHSRANQYATARVAIRELRRDGEGGCVEPSFRFRVVQLPLSYEIGPVEKLAGIGAVGGEPCRERGSGLNSSDSVDLPAAKERICNRAQVRQKLPAFAPGQLVVVAKDQPVAHVEVRKPTLGPEIVVILRAVACADAIEISRG